MIFFNSNVNISVKNYAKRAKEYFCEESTVTLPNMTLPIHLND